MKKFLHWSFIIFLFAYALFITAHVFEIIWTPQTVMVFVCGISLAFLAHARKNYITIAILAVHMGIEWFEWSHQKLELGQIAFNCIHAVMDFVFLSHELKVHIRLYRKPVLIVLAGVLALVFVFGHLFSVGAESIKNLEPFVIGGVLGCVLSHIYFHIKKE